MDKQRGRDGISFDNANLRKLDTAIDKPNCDPWIDNSDRDDTNGSGKQQKYLRRRNNTAYEGDNSSE